MRLIPANALLREWKSMSRWTRYGLICGAATLAVKAGLDFSPAIADAWYGQLYRMIIPLLRAFTYLFPFPWYYLFWSGVVLLILVYVVKCIKWAMRKKWSELSKDGILGFLGYFGWMVTLFYLLWGFNYSRPNWCMRMDIESLAVDSIMVWKEYQWVKDKINTYADSLPIREARTSGQFYTSATEAKLNNLCNAVLADFELRGGGVIKVRKLWPGTLLHFSTAGFYLPLTGEANLDAGLYPLQWPYVAAHEIFHGLGVTDEGDCNFLALLACLKSDDPIITYSGLEAYWKELATVIKRHDRQRFMRELEEFPDSFKQDLNSIFRYQAKYKDILPRVRHYVYHQYLRSQGVKAGLLSYNQVISLMYHYRDAKASASK